MKNPSLVVTADHTLKIEDAPILEPGPGEVLLHVRATGICGSDIHFWRHGKIGDLVVEGDCILGHESAGEVVKLGPGVETLNIGDRVAIEPGVPCGTCFVCLDGRYNLCERVKFSGVYPHAGTMQRYKVHPVSYLHKIPDSMSYGLAALLEPFSVALHGLYTTPVNIGTAVAVFGAGPIGLLTMAAARASGAHPIVITDTDQSRLEFARDFEPNCLTYQVSLSKTPEENAHAIQKIFIEASTSSENGPFPENELPNLVLECTGIESSISTAAYTVRRGGSINVIGLSAKPLVNNIPFIHISLREIQLRFINRYHGTWPRAIRALTGNLVDAAKIEAFITHRFSIDKAIDAMELVGGTGRSKCSDRVIKVQVVDEETK